MASNPTAPTPAGASPTNHGLRVIVAWIVLSLVATPLVAIFVGPILPPGNDSVQASGQVLDNTVLTATITPVLCLLLVFFVYSLTTFHAPAATALEDGPPLRNHNGIQVTWIVITSAVVLALAGFGTFELLQTGSGGGQGPSPVANPSGINHMMQVQVIGQQWNWTYRYPGYGGVETQQLFLPEHTYVQLNVTSLDVIHSFWAYKLGVKADANPGVNNVAYVKTKGPLSFEIRCAELCGLWHGYMYQTGHIVPQTAFASWIKQQRKLGSSVSFYLPKYSHFYYPDPQRRGG
ncbi:MAG TPA: cytochrome c oxidase subunit II [Gaiellaceae bacterium]|nr:cytochrome c oxidase subunit II [Gaiellaceae bacterium]